MHRKVLGIIVRPLPFIKITLYYDCMTSFQQHISCFIKLANEVDVVSHITNHSSVCAEPGCA